MDRWICTDPDTFQWQRHLGGRKYEMCDTIHAYVEHGWWDDKSVYYVAHGIVDLDELCDDHVNELHQTYGYDDMQDDPVIAEMEFEHGMLSSYVEDEWCSQTSACSKIAMRYLVDA